MTDEWEKGSHGYPVYAGGIVTEVSLVEAAGDRQRLGKMVISSLERDLAGALTA